MSDPILHIQDLTFSWDPSSPLLQGVSLTIQAGDCVALVGRNGAGKSTLFKLACGLEKPHSGQVNVAGLNTTTARPPALAKRVSLMFQEAERQICHHRVDTEVGFSPRLAGYSKPEIHARVCQALEMTGLSGKADRHPLDLNAGERRLVTLAALIAQDTPLILLDEPTRDFDRPLLARFEQWMQRVRGEGRAILFISHDLDFVARHANRVIHLSGGQIIADGDAVSVLHHPHLQTETSLAPTLPALCQALGFSPTSQPEEFDAQWRRHLRDRRN